MSEHVQDVVVKCAQSLHFIRVLHRHGVNDLALQAVYRTVVLAKLLYASSAWWASRRQMIGIALKLSFAEESGLVWTNDYSTRPGT